MLRNKIIIGSLFCLTFLFFSCSNQKNTKQTRLYHEINTRYNIYYNAEIAYEEALEEKEKSYEDNLSKTIYVYPYYPDYEENKNSTFEATIDKAVKAIKLHSIQAKPKRDPGKRGNVKYQEWLQQKEFNPFLKNVWLLMAKAEYQSLDYTRAISTFSYITRLYRNDPEVVAEANLWIAKAYTQMGWFYEADNVFHQIELTGGVPKSLRKEFAEIYADYLVRDKQFEKAVPYLEEAIKNAGGLQAIRLKYLLGQAYSELGQKNNAYEAFDKVPGLKTPYQYALNARLQQSKFIDPHNSQQKKEVLSSLDKMTKGSKNEEYLDQVYYAIGNVHLVSNDTANAVKNYTLAVEKSTRNGYDKAVVGVALGDIYFAQKEYVKAQPLYPEALGILGSTYERYNELLLRSEVLDELVVYVEAIHLQDSLLHLASLPEAELLAAIDKIIEEKKKADEEEEKRLAQEKWREENPDEERPDMVIQPSSSNQKSSFYFYNKQTVAQGKATFKQRWGNRKLEDNWRRKEKAASAFGGFDNLPDEIDTEIQADSIISTDMEETSQQTADIDVYSREYYINQIPLTDEEKQEAHAIIEDGYYQMGLIYKNKLGDLYLAIDAFNTVIQRYPSTSNLEEIYYQLFLIYSQLGNKNMADLYRNKLINEFPDGAYAITLSDPDYESNLRNLKQLENDLYDRTYEAYLVGNVNTVRQYYTTAKDKYPLSGLMPKFMFLYSLTYAQTNEPKLFQDNLKELVTKYPDSEVTSLANELLQGIMSGKTLAAGGPMRGMIWDMQFTGGDYSNIDTTLTFIDKKDAEHMVLLFFEGEKVKKNELLYDVADYNFSNFIVQTFDLSFSEIQPFELLQIQPFNSFRNVTEYINKIFDENSLLEKLDSTILIIPISADNYKILNRGKSLGEYMQFFMQNYTKEMPELIAYWKTQMDEMEQTGEEEELQDIDTEITSEETETETEPLIPEEDIEKEVEEVETETPIIKPDESQFIPKKEIITEQEKEEDTGEKEEEGLEKVISDEDVNKVVDGAKDVGSAIGDIMSNPVDGLKKIFEKKPEKTELTKEEKESSKEEKRLSKELEKERKKREKAINDSIKAVEKAVQDSIKQAAKEEEEMEKAAIRAKEDARKDAIKAKEDARKARQQELKEKEKAREQRLKEREQERKERQKEKERERKEREKQREQERKERQKQREQERKEKERAARERRRN